MDALCELTATEAAAAIRQRKLSPVQLVRALADRIEAIESGIQAWVSFDRERAEKAAAESERRQRDGDSAPLLGVPFGVKDIFFTAGVPTAAGFPPFNEFVPAYSAAAVERLERAGAIMLGKTETTQFACFDPAPTKNPWHPERTPGGSSSGSAAAVAARMVPVALGSQTAGSVLRPSAYCGVVGLKPTFGRISRYGVFPVSWSLDHVGIIARSVEDTALLLGVLAGHDSRDPASARRSSTDFLGALKGETRVPKLGLLVDAIERADAAVRVGVLETARNLESAGARVDEVHLPSPLDDLLSVQQVIMQCEAATVHSELIQEHPSGYHPRLRAFIENGHLIPAPVYLHAQRLRRRFRAEIDRLVKRFDALLLPTAVNVAPELSTTGDPSLQAPWTLLGLPSISLPTGLDADRLPRAVQLVATRYREDRLLQTAHWCEQVFEPMPAPTL